MRWVRVQEQRQTGRRKQARVFQCFSNRRNPVRRISSSQRKIIVLHIKESNVCNNPLSLLCLGCHKTPVFAVETPHHLARHIALPSSFIVTLDLMVFPTPSYPSMFNHTRYQRMKDVRKQNTVSLVWHSNSKCFLSTLDNPTHYWRSQSALLDVSLQLFTCNPVRTCHVLITR